MFIRALYWTQRTSSLLHITTHDLFKTHFNNVLPSMHSSHKRPFSFQILPAKILCAFLMYPFCLKSHPFWFHHSKIIYEKKTTKWGLFCSSLHFPVRNLPLLQGNSLFLQVSKKMQGDSFLGINCLLLISFWRQLPIIFEMRVLMW